MTYNEKDGEGQEETGCGISGWLGILCCCCVGKVGALNVLCHTYPQREPPSPLNTTTTVTPSPHAPTPLTIKLHRCACRQNPEKAFWCPSYFWGDCRNFGCGAKNNKQGGSCVRGEAGRPRNQRWLVKKEKQRIKERVPRNWSQSVSLKNYLGPRLRQEHENLFYIVCSSYTMCCM